MSGMVDTAKGIVENLMDLVEKFGFMPNGARTYYENRRYDSPPSRCTSNLNLANLELRVVKEHQSCTCLVMSIQRSSEEKEELGFG